jgi:GDSL-like Lipase/Acylhydrolase family
MSPEGHGLILPTAQSFVPTAQLSSSAAPPFTRRVIHAVAAGASGSGLTNNQELNLRLGLTWPQAATRMRLRIRNADVLANTVNTTAVAMTGAFIGTPNSAAENAWAGDFTAAPTSLGLSFTATDIGTSEYVSAWVTPTGQVAGKTFGLSLGFTCATDSQINTDTVPGWLFHGLTGSGAAAAASGAAVPSGGGIIGSPTRVPFDLRIEYEFVGRGQIGFFIGDSLTAGYVATTGVPYGQVGTANSWPGMAGQRLGHGVANGGIGGCTTANWNSLALQSWTRFTDPTSGTIFGGTKPDYAVILLGVNDATGLISLATYQANILTMIGFLQGLGVNRIFVCTAPIGTVTGAGFGLPTFQNGLLQTALSAGATTSVVIQAVTTTAGTYQTNQPSGPGGGLTSGSGSGPAANWTNGAQCWLEVPASGIAEGPLVVTGGSGATTLTLTVTSFVLAHAHKVGAPVLAAAEGLRENYNYWLGQVPPGATAMIDMAKAAMASGAPPYEKHWDYYGQTDNPHPVTPALYASWAAQFAAGFAGL